MTMRLTGLPLLLIIAAALGARADEPKLSPEDTQFFEQKIRPLLIERCLDCHSHAKKIKGGLALDTRPGWEKGGDTGTALKPGKPDDSLLIQAIRYQEANLKMPPAGKLKDAEIALLEEWVRRGAPDPRSDKPSTPPSKGYDAEAARKHWAYQPLQGVTVPPVQDQQWPVNDVDHFVLAALEARGWTHANDAERAAWLRRVSLDLTGLPPTLDEVQAYLNDGSPLADAAVVDRLLASRAYGERWARAWMDLVGYADQIGSANNVPAEHAWRYRDYLIEAFERDKPYDVMIREQLAGDLLTANSIEQRREQLTATGFLVLGNVNIVDADKLIMRMDLVDFQIEKIGKTFLGMTLNCVRCHDHKFDPITQRDYYGLAGILASTDSTYKDARGIWSSVIKLTLPETLAQFTAREALVKQHERKLAALQQERTALEQRLNALGMAMLSAPDSADGQPAGTKTKAELQKEEGEIQGQLRNLQATVWHMNYVAPSAPMAFGVKEGTEIDDTFLQIRGNPHARGTQVPRGFVAVATHGPSPELPTDQSGRAQLADWLTGAARPLVARTAVNRVWQKMFGRGLVASTDYFGLRSDPPSHPELLEHLSRRFIDDGWSFKRLLRTIALSRTYRQSSDLLPTQRELAATDPENVFLWRISPRRLEAEMLRDSVLLATGSLQASSGGPSLALEFRENVGGLDPKDVNPINFGVRKFRDDQPFLRTVYLPVVRSSDQKGPGDVLNFFDFTQPHLMTATRATTAVSSQALFLLNGPLLKESAKRLTASLRSDQSLPGDAERLQNLWLRLLNRPITPDEQSAALDFLTTTVGSPESAWEQLAHGLMISNEFLFRL